GFSWSAHAVAAGGAHMDFRSAQPHDLPRAYFVGPARLGDAIDFDRAAGHQVLAGATAVAQAGKLEQQIELDVVAGQFESQGGHGWAVAVVAVIINRYWICGRDFWRMRHGNHLPL